MAGDSLEDWPRPSRLRVVGLDPAWSPRNPTGGCVVAWDGRVARLVEPPRADLSGNDEIVEYVRDGTRDEPAVVAIDCPLAVPNRTGLRECDRLVNTVFRPFEAGVYPANRHNLGRYGGLRGENLARALMAQGFSLDPRSSSTRGVIEVYPHAAMVTLFHLRKTLKYKARSGRGYEQRWRELARLQRFLLGLRLAKPGLRMDDEVVRKSPKGLRGRRFKEVEDALDALVCAYVGLLYGLEGLRRCAVFGDQRQGHILIPFSPKLYRSVPPDRRRNVAFDP